MTGYEDGRDAVGKIYSNLDLSRIIVPNSDNELYKVSEAPIEEVPTEERLIEEAPIEGVPTKEASTEQAPAIVEVVSTSEGVALESPPTFEELASALAIIDVVAVEDADR